MEIAPNIHTQLCSTAELASLSAFFLFGLAGSLHCVLMCGPLSCVVTRRDKSSVLPLSLYHFGRLISYSVLALAVWLIGIPFRLSLPLPALAAMLSLPLAVYAFSPRDRSPQWLKRWHPAGTQLLKKLPAPLRGLGLGLLTPGLPCGLLYAALAACAAAPSALIAAGWMLAFGAGTFPLLAASQFGLTQLKTLGGSSWALQLRRITAALAAGGVLAISLMHQ